MRYPAVDPDVIELGALVSKARRDIPQAFAVSQLGEHQAQKLFQASEASDFVFFIESLDAPTKRGQRKMARCLRSNQLRMHRYHPRIRTS